MLISEPAMGRTDPILVMVANISGRSGQAVELQTGVYSIGHFGSSDFLRGYDEYPDLSVGCYGVCDSVDQLLKMCPELEGSEDRQFVVTVTEIRKADEPSSGGWRWHKWGEYIGIQCPLHEYIYDEPRIYSVLVYQIYEKQT